MNRIDAFDPRTWMNGCWLLIAIAVVVLIAIVWPTGDGETADGETADGGDEPEHPELCFCILCIPTPKEFDDDGRDENKSSDDR